jgi:2-oxoisovalerate dehydrogenase E1 component
VFESRSLYQTSGEVHFSDVIEPMGKSCLRKPGRDAMIVTWGTGVPIAMEAATRLAQQGADVGVLDLRWLCPLDESGLYSAVANASGRAIILHEANRTAGFGAEVSARLHESLGSRMALSVTRIATPDMRIPAASVLQRALLPSAETVVAEAGRLLALKEQ